jgi:metal-responsive CopG/Arc/MetJ family transcriptional regulator
VEAEKNLHATIPAALLAKMEDVAHAERISVDELVRDAVQRRLDTHEWHELLAFGEKHAQSRGLTEADVAEAIAEARGR